VQPEELMPRGKLLQVNAGEVAERLKAAVCNQAECNGLESLQQVTNGVTA
jgi:hypothetical protein